VQVVVSGGHANPWVTTGESPDTRFGAMGRGGACVTTGAVAMSAGICREPLASHTPRDPVALAEAPLQQLTLNDHHVAVRSVRVR